MLLHDMLGRGVKLFGDIPAVVDGDVRLTYNQLSGRVHKLAAALQNLGLEHGDHVAIFASNSFRYMEAYLAVSVAGVVLAPINTRLSARETEFILNDGGIKALLIGAEFLPLLEEMRENLKTIERIVVLDGEPKGELLGYEALVDQADPGCIRSRDWAEDDMVLLCYTGGTTGLPKGVMLSQRNISTNAIHAIQLAELNERDIWLHVCPMFHMADLWSCYSFSALGALHVFTD